MLDRTHRLRRAAAAATVAIAAVVLASCGDSTGPKNKQNALQPKGPYAHKILNLTRPFFWIAVAVGIGVIGATIYVALRFRQKPGEDRQPKQVHGNTVLEVSWTIIPALILAVMAVPTVATIFDLAKKPSGPTVNVTVTARQWWWQFTYTDNGVETANEMHIPVGVPVVLRLQGPPACSQKGCYENGVIHSFWIPALNGKKDVVPGRVQPLKLLASKPGTFMGQCAEYCGLSHADMRMRVIAQPMAEYQAWVQSQLTKRPTPEALQLGVQNSTYGCTSCHSFESGKAGSLGPNLAHLADREKFAGDIYDMTWQNLGNWIYDAPKQKPAGPLVKAGQWMPNFSEKGMTKQDACQIARFLLENTATNPKPLVGDCK